MGKPTDSIDVNKCRLIYIPEQIHVNVSEQFEDEYILKPYWEFDFTEFSTLLNLDEITNEYGYSATLIVDAQTRKVDVNDSPW